jgi:pimeloyl-ACP methyl ester carboxylesterase
MSNTTVLLVHGAWHGAWCWAPVQTLLEDAGVASVAVDLPGQGASPLPLSDMHGDAASVVATMRAIGGNFVLVGHSYGGSVVSEVAHLVLSARDTEGPTISHIVHISAFPLDEGESPMTTILSMPPAETLMGPAMVPLADGSVSLDPVLAPGALFNLCTPAQTRAAMARVRPFNGASLTQPVSGSEWRSVESTYVVCDRDMAIHPEHQRAMAGRCTHTVVLDTDHAAFTSMPRETAAVIMAVVPD